MSAARMLFVLAPFAACFGQVSGPGKAEPVPETVLFRFFFREVEFLEGAAQRAAKAGRDAEGPRREIERRLGLTAREASLVKEIAASCDAQERRHREDTATQARALREQSRKGPAEKVDAERQRAELLAAGDRITNDCLNRLRTGLGATRFGRLAALVKASVGPRIKALPAPEALR